MADADPKLAQQQQFGDAVRRVRKSVGLSQERLAQVAGLDRAYVGHVENGRRNLTLNAMWQLAKALQVSPAEFFPDRSVLPDAETSTTLATSDPS